MSDLCDEVMPALVRALHAETNEEVVERVAHGLDNCMEHMHEDALAQYLPEIMPPLLALISHADARMHDTLLSCISSAAAAGGEGFEPFAGACCVLCYSCIARLATCAVLRSTKAMLTTPGLLSLHKRQHVRWLQV